MSDANKDLADVRGWLCDNLSSGDAGKVCGMLSSVSRRINELEAENAELKKAMDFQALELGCMTDNRDVLHVENKNLRELVAWMYRLMDESCAVQHPYAPEPIRYDTLIDVYEKLRELGVA